MRMLLVADRITILRLAAALALFSCATPKPGPERTNTELNQGRSVPDAPGDSSEISPKLDPPGEDPAARSMPVERNLEVPSSRLNGAVGVFHTMDFVNVRKGPGNRFEISRRLKKGAQVTALSDENEEWVKIGEGEYIARRLLSDKAP